MGCFRGVLFLRTPWSRTLKGSEVTMLLSIVAEERSEIPEWRGEFFCLFLFGPEWHLWGIFHRCKGILKPSQTYCPLYISQEYSNRNCLSLINIENKCIGRTLESFRNYWGGWGIRFGTVPWASAELVERALSSWSPGPCSLLHWSWGSAYPTLPATLLSLMPQKPGPSTLTTGTAKSPLGDLRVGLSNWCSLDPVPDSWLQRRL